MTDFRKSMEAAFRRTVRQAIKRAPLTRAEREITIVLTNLWFVHRNGQFGFIHPSKRAIAKRARCTERTVQRCLQMLKGADVLTITKNEKGGKRLAPHYRLSITALLTLCNADIPTETEGYLKAMHTTDSESPIDGKSNGKLPQPKGDKCLPLGGSERETKCLPVYSTYIGWPNGRENTNPKIENLSLKTSLVWAGGEGVGNA